jgi:hypothetical protein
MEKDFSSLEVFKKWRCHDLLNADGIIVGCTQSVEWMLPWWWMHYHFHNSFPVTFVDMGMTDAARVWCQKRGELIALKIPESFIAMKEAVEPSLAELWMRFHGRDFWPARKGWFKKPFAFLLSPYKRTIWLDVDCQVRRSLGELFKTCDNPGGLAIAPDPFQFREGLKGFIHRGEVLYNSGVVVYARGSPLIQEWAERTLDWTDHFAGDQNILSRVIFLKKVMFCELSLYYNWLLALGLRVPAAIRHFGGPYGKKDIQTEIAALKNLFLMDLSLS